MTAHAPCSDIACIVCRPGHSISSTDAVVTTITWSPGSSCGMDHDAILDTAPSGGGTVLRMVPEAQVEALHATIAELQRQLAEMGNRPPISEVLNAFIDAENGHGNGPLLADLSPYDAIRVATDHVAAKYGLQHDNVEGAWIPVEPAQVSA